MYHKSADTMSLSAWESIDWIHINADIENAFKTALCVLIFKEHNQKIGHCHMRYQGHCRNVLQLCILDYYSTLSVVKHFKGISSDNLIKSCEIIFAECGLPMG